MVAQNKTMPTDASVQKFIDSVQDPQRRQDAQRLMELFSSCTGEPAVMWGPSIIGFGWNHYRYASGREGDQPAVGFSPRKANMALYGLINTEAAHKKLDALGKHKTSVGCLYLNVLSDVDLDVLATLIRDGYALMQTGPA